MNFKTWLIGENFDTVSDFILNPEHRNKTWSELEKEFLASGGKVIGYGKFGTVFFHPSWPYILKIYSDSYYTAFVRFAYRNPNLAVPKFFGPPQRVLPFYKRQPEHTYQYLVRMEKLHPIDQATFNVIHSLYWQGIQYIDALEKGYADQEYEKEVIPKVAERRAGKLPYKVKVKHFQEIMDAVKKNPKLLNLFKTMRAIQQNVQGEADYHIGNFMQRDNGDVIITDPVWEGETPYTSYKRMLDSEVGHDFDEPEPSVIGGQFPKKKRVRKTKPKNYDQSEIPF